MKAAGLWWRSCFWNCTSAKVAKIGISILAVVLIAVWRYPLAPSPMLGTSAADRSSSASLSVPLPTLQPLSPTQVLPPSLPSTASLQLSSPPQAAPLALSPPLASPTPKPLHRCNHSPEGSVTRGREIHGLVDVVVEWYCEDISWLKDLSPSLSSEVALWIVDKGAGKQCEARQKFEAIVDALPFPVTILSMRNVGRDGHSQTAFIHRYYAELAKYTVFVQGQHHWYIMGMSIPSFGARWQDIKNRWQKFDLHIDINAKGWSSQPEAVHDIVRKAIAENADFLPIVPYSSKGPVLAEDLPPGKIEEADFSKLKERDFNYDNTFFFDGTHMRQEGSDMFVALFGKRDGDKTPLPFSPGMQYLISRERLQSRPCDDWYWLTKSLADCFRFIWAFERVTTDVFNTTKPLKNPDGWTKLPFCRTLRRLGVR
eukprot:TRINITY_DN75987_c0_g1_i1.p1 TRINITY_DN75987_c0_g1~~TRINITY_DN75987_c0_g1_i1.p1  ORF type:complete len:427 (-),score=50.00 TRINITY_DN75987_c0_g1_i1:245-1525(-)